MFKAQDVDLYSAYHAYHGVHRDIFTFQFTLVSLNAYRQAFHIKTVNYLDQIQHTTVIISKSRQDSWVYSVRYKLK